MTPRCQLFHFLYIIAWFSLSVSAVRASVEDTTSDIYSQTAALSLRGSEPRCSEKHISRLDTKSFVGNREWFHQIRFDSLDLVSKGYDPTISKIAQNVMSLPADLSGKKVLDIGAYDGAYSIEAAKRGATKVVSVDYFAWVGKNKHYFHNYCFARKYSGFAHIIDYKWCPVEELSPAKFGGNKFDYIFFFGILYHADNPIGYLRRVLLMLEPGGTALVETVVDLLELPYPALKFYEGETRLNGDETNDFGPNEIAVCALMRKAGFTDVKVLQRNYENLLNVQMTKAALDAHPRLNQPQNARTTFVGKAPL